VPFLGRRYRPKRHYARDRALDLHRHLACQRLPERLSSACPYRIIGAVSSVEPSGEKGSTSKADRVIGSALKKPFGRLLGGDGTRAWKSSDTYTPRPKTGYSGQSSVLEVGSVDATDDEDLRTPL
jgi:hypothetical protein